MADGIAEPRRNATPPVVNNVYTQRPAFMSATQVLRRRILLKVHHQLLKVIEEIFINPQAAYLQQDSDNKRALRVRKVVREQAMKTTADKVSEAIQAEGNVDPKLVKILIKDAVEAKFQEATAGATQQASISKKKQTKGKSNNTASKNSRGAQSGGASSTKKKSPTRASGNSGGESGNAANAAKKGRRPQSQEKSKKSGTKSTTKNNKTGGRSKKK